MTTGPGGRSDSLLIPFDDVLGDDSADSSSMLAGQWLVCAWVYSTLVVLWDYLVCRCSACGLQGLLLTLPVVISLKACSGSCDCLLLKLQQCLIQGCACPEWLCDSCTMVHCMPWCCQCMGGCLQLSHTYVCQTRAALYPPAGTHRPFSVVMRMSAWRACSKMLRSVNCVSLCVRMAQQFCQGADSNSSVYDAPGDQQGPLVATK